MIYVAMNKDINRYDFPYPMSTKIFKETGKGFI